MPLGQRILQVNLTMPDGSVVALDDTLDVRVHVKRVAYEIQSVAEVTVFNLSASLKQMLLTRINAYTNNRVQTGQIQSAWIPVQIIAGYETFASNAMQTNVTSIFTGQAFMARPVGSLPSMGIQITCATNQYDKTRIPTAVPPGQMTFKSLVAWVAGQLGVNYVCQTSNDSRIVTNPLASVYTMSGLIAGLAGSTFSTGPRVEVFIDVDGTLIARDLGATIKGSPPIVVDEFINPPYSTEQGVQFRVLYDPRIRMISNLQIQSTQNPWLNGGWVPYSVQFDLQTRDTPFYMVVDAVPPSGATLS